MGSDPIRKRVADGVRLLGGSLTLSALAELTNRFHAGLLANLRQHANRTH